MDAEDKALVKALLDKDAIVKGGVLYCAPVMLKAAAALTAALDDRENAERYRELRQRYSGADKEYRELGTGQVGRPVMIFDAPRTELRFSFDYEKAALL